MNKKQLEFIKNYEDRKQETFYLDTTFELINGNVNDMVFYTFKTIEDRDNFLGEDNLDNGIVKEYTKKEGIEIALQELEEYTYEEIIERLGDKNE